MNTGLVYQHLHQNHISAMKPVILTLTALLLLTVMTHAVDPKFKPQNSDGKLPCQLFTPEIKPGEKYPIVLFLHGAGERGDNNTSQLKHGAKVFASPENQEKHPCFIIAPQCPIEQWWSGQNLDNAIAIVDELAKDPRVDTKRLYITGLSMGGFGTWSALEQRPKLFAAAIPICGGGNPSHAKLFKHIPIRAFHGDADKVVTPDKSQSMIDALETAGAKDATLTLYPKVGHNSWKKAYANPEVITWLFSHSK